MEYTTPEGAPQKKRMSTIQIIVLLLVIAVVAVAVVWYLLNHKPAETQTGPSEEEQKAALRAAQARLLVTPEAIGISPDAYREEVAKLAEEADTITMGTGCTMDPLIIKMKEGSVLKLNNLDTTEHMLAFEDENFFAVAPGQLREINITQVFGKGEGIYRYRCGDVSRDQNVGIMYIVK